MLLTVQYVNSLQAANDRPSMRQGLSILALYFKGDSLLMQSQRL